MSTFFRRAGAAIARFLKSAADPAAAANEIKVYSKLVGGIAQLFAIASDGTIYQITPSLSGTGSGLEPEFATGVDGNLVFDGAATILGFVPAAGVYQVTRDIFPANMQIDVGVRVKMNGCGVFGKGTLTDNGRLDNAGNDAPGGATSTGGALQTVRRFGSGVAGGSGGAAPSASANDWYGYYQTMAGGTAGGAAGNGGLGGAGAGGGGGGSPSTAGTIGGNIVIGVGTNGGPSFRDLVNGRWTAGQTPNFGGGGGSGGAGTGQAGGGGAGGGCLAVFFPFITGIGVIDTNGGNGAHGTGGTGFGGGGGGGGGGMNIVRYVTLASVSIVSGGGLGANGGAGAGRGGDGGPGPLVIVPVL